MESRNEANGTDTTRRDVFKGALNFETSRMQAKDASEKKAWRVAAAACAVSVLLGIAIVFMMPLKQPAVPYVLHEDAKSGVTQQLTILKDTVVAGDAVRDKYWVGQYVMAREHYDWNSLQNDYDLVGIYSSPEEGRSYQTLFDGKDALDKKWADKYRASVEISSSSVINATTVQVRFVKYVKAVAEASKGRPSCYIATVAYEYRNPSKMSEKSRMVNPWGFQVTSYRVDADVCTGGDQ